MCIRDRAGTASAHLENYNDGIKSKDLSDFHSNKASAPVSETSFSLNILYEDTDIPVSYTHLSEVSGDTHSLLKCCTMSPA